MKITAPIIIGLAMTASATTAQTLGPEWEEGVNGEAGSLPGTAQIPQVPGGGPLFGIRGRLNGTLAQAGGDFQDVYRIFIADPQNFVATTVFAFDGEADFNTQLFLFDCDGHGVLANDDFAPDDDHSFLQSASNDGSGAVLTEPGIYYLAITGFDSDAQAGGFDIFNMPPGSTEISGPDGPGGANPLTNWSQDGQVGEYRIALNGCQLFDALNPPCPGDINGDFNVDVNDLLELLARWGECPRLECEVGFICDGGEPMNCGGDPGCFCVTAIDGLVVCALPPASNCDEFKPCLDSSEECGPGLVCIIDTCCTTGVCMIPCSSDAASGDNDRASDGNSLRRPTSKVFGDAKRDAAGASSALTEPGCPGDLNFDGYVDVDDLLILLAGWGPCDCNEFPFDS